MSNSCEEVRWKLGKERTSNGVKIDIGYDGICRYGGGYGISFACCSSTPVSLFVSHYLFIYLFINFVCYLLGASYEFESVVQLFTLHWSEVGMQS